MHSATTNAFGVVCTLCCIAAPALGRDDEGCLFRPAPDDAKTVAGYDAATGRDTRRYGPDRIVDFQHMKLTLDIPDMNRPHLSAVQTLKLTPISRKVAELTLDAHLLDVKSVECAGHKAAFKNERDTLTVTFDPPLEPGAAAEVVTKYDVDDPPQGLTWTPESPSWPGRPAQLHSQGQAESNSYWFPCHDFPNERLTTELIVTVPAGFIVSANGRQVEDSAKPPAGRATFHWLQDKPHVNYLVSLVVGKFDVVDIAGRGKSVPLPVYVPPGKGPDVARSYSRTPQMIDLFGKLTGQPYPWDRYAQLVVWNFGAGGMENTSATTMYDTAVLSEAGAADQDLDGLISHELAHQWFGDLITCNTWDHIWLNEGFATYFANLWSEQRAGNFGTNNDAYQAGILGNFDTLIERDHAEAPRTPGMVSKAYKDPGESFGRAANPYPKGSSVLHMLRQRLGDDAFFRGIAAYVAQYKLKTVETGDFRRVMEDVSGESLEQFFRQWCFRPGVPDLTVNVTWDDTKRELTVVAEQKQAIDGANPAFVFDLPIWVDTGRESASSKSKSAPAPQGRTLTLEVRGRKAEATFSLPSEPAIVAIDPNLSVLSKLTITQPTRNWVAQLERGPTLASRVQAARALGAEESAAAHASLAQAAGSAAAHAKTRSEAIDALKKLKDGKALLDLSAKAADLPVDARVTLIEAVASLATAKDTDAQLKPRLTSLLAAHAGTKEPSFRTRASALRGLGKLKAADQLHLLVEAAAAESQHDRVRQGALEALGDMDAKEGLAVAIRYALPGAYNRTRPVAIEAVRKLAHHDPDAAYKVLASLLSDRERRAWESAGEALAALNDPRAAADFQKLAAAKRDDRDKKRVAGWEEKLTKHAGE